MVIRSGNVFNNGKYQHRGLLKGTTHQRRDADDPFSSGGGTVDRIWSTAGRSANDSKKHLEIQSEERKTKDWASRFGGKVCACSFIIAAVFTLKWQQAKNEEAE